MRPSEQALLFLCAFCAHMVHAQAPPIAWQHTYGGSDDEVGRSIQRTADGGYFVGGFTYSYNGDVSGQHGDRDLWVFKIDSVGAIQWQRTMGNFSWNEAEQLRATPDGGCIVVGTTADGVQFDRWLIKLDSLGNTKWERPLGGGGTDIGNSVDLAPDGGYITAGTTDSNDGDVIGNHGLNDVWVVRTDSAGTTLWQHCYGGSAHDGYGYIRQTSEGGYIFLAYSSSTDGEVTGNQGNSDLWVVKLDTDGAIEWQRTLGGSNSETPRDIIRTAEGGYMIVAFSGSNDGDLTSNQGGDDVWLVKLDVAGEVEWQRSYGGPASEVASTILQMDDGGYLFTGHTTSTVGTSTGNHGSADLWAIRLDATGNVLWHQCIGGSDFDTGYDLVLLPDGHVMLAGMTQSADGDVQDFIGVRDVWLIEFGEEDIHTSIPSPSSSPFLVAPNPTDGLLHITPDASGSTGHIKMYNAVGQFILELPPHTGQLEVDLSMLPAGIYHLTEKRGDHLRTVRIVLN